MREMNAYRRIDHDIFFKEIDGEKEGEGEE